MADSEKTGPAAGTETAPSAAPSREVSAATVARMMGLATAAEVRMLEGKIDLLTTKLNAIGAKLDRLATLASSLAVGADLERIDVHIGSIKSVLKEAFPQFVRENGEHDLSEAKPRPKVVSSDDAIKG